MESVTEGFSEPDNVDPGTASQDYLVHTRKPLTAKRLSAGRQGFEPR